MSPLRPCAHCGRHIRSAEHACPFCSARVRAAMVVGGACIVLTLAGCKDDPPKVEAKLDAAIASASDASSAPPASSAELEERARSKAKLEAGVLVPVYGGPPTRPRASGSAKPPCECKPGDPLCVCE